MAYIETDSQARFRFALPNTTINMQRGLRSPAHHRAYVFSSTYTSATGFIHSNVMCVRAPEENARKTF